ncbi:MAG: exodeoxyribonuclease III [Pseudomonadota bacterium]
MKIASWNVNSLKIRLEQVLDWCREEQPTLLGLQETKLTDDKFPAAAIEEIGYHVVYAGQPTYNGVAVLSTAPVEDVVTDVPGLDDPQRRIMACTLGDTRLVNLYVVNGKAVGTDKFAYKLEWLARVTEYVESQLERFENVAVIGDFNIAPDDRDVYDPVEWREKIHCSTPEREALGHFFDLGFADSFRLHHEDGGIYSWWDYRAAAYRRKMGLRIDLILTSPALSERCIASYVDEGPRKLERPSDHTPVVAEFED